MLGPFGNTPAGRKQMRQRTWTSAGRTTPIWACQGDGLGKSLLVLSDYRIAHKEKGKIVYFKKIGLS